MSRTPSRDSDRRLARMFTEIAHPAVLMEVHRLAPQDDGAGCHASCEGRQDVRVDDSDAVAFAAVHVEFLGTFVRI